MMTVEKTIQYIDDLLEINGLCKNGEGQLLRQVLHYIYSALTLYEQLDEKDRKLLKLLQKKIEIFFVSKIKLKERRRKTEKKIFPPHPLYKEKEKKEKEEKSPPIILVASDFSSDEDYLKYRQEQFRQECLARKDLYGEDTCLRFFYTWGEENKKKMKMRWEMLQTWNIDNRLRKFSKISYERKDEAAQIGLENAKRMKAKQEAVTQQQAAISEIREDNNAKLEREIAERKKGAVSYEEYLKMKDEKLKMKSTQKEPSLLCKN